MSDDPGGYGHPCRPRPGDGHAAASASRPRWAWSCSPRWPPWGPPARSSRSPPTRGWPRTCRTRRSSSASSCRSSRSSTTGRRPSSSPGSGSSTARSSPSTRSRPSSWTPPPRSRTAPSGRTRASTRSASSPPASTPCAAGPAALRPSPSSSSASGSSTRRARPRRRSRPAASSRRSSSRSASPRPSPARQGKQRIMAAYLNQNYYGNESYGVAAAAKGYFGVELQDLTLAQAAILAALLQAPGSDDLVQNAVVECVDPAADPETCEETQLVVPADARIVERRNFVLDQMAAGGTPLTGDAFGAEDFAAAKAEKVVLAAQRSTEWKLPQFVRQVRRELVRRLCGEDAETCPVLERGGLEIVSTIDLRAPGDRREVGRGRRHRPAGQVAQGGRQGARPPVRAVDGQPARQEAAQRRADRHGLRDRPDRRLPGLREPDRHQGDQALPAPLRRPRRRLAPAGLRVQARRVRDRHRRAADHRRHHVHGRRDRLRRRLHPDRRRQPRARPGPRSQRPPVLAQHPGRQGARRHRQRPRSRRRPRTWASPSGTARWMPASRSRWASRRSTSRTWSAPTATLANGGKLVYQTTIVTVTDGTGVELIGAGDDAQARAGARPGHGRDHDRHPRRQHGPQGEPVLGQVQDHRGQAAAAGDAQDRHQQRRPRPQRVRLHRRAEHQGAGERRVRAGGRRLERQLGQLAGHDGQGPAVLDRRDDLRLAGLPPGGDRGLVDQRLPEAGLARRGRGGPVDGPGGGGRQDA